MSWVPPAEFPRLQGPLTIALDTETKDDGIRLGRGAGWCFKDHGYVVGWSVATAGAQWYFPIRHEEGGNLDERGVKRWLRDTLKQTDLTVVMHNRLYDEGWLRREDIAVKSTVYDTLTAAPLLDEYKRKYSLDMLSKEYLGRGGKDEALLTAEVKRRNTVLRADILGEYPGKVNTAQRNALFKTGKWHEKETLWRMHSQHVGEYAETDARLTYDLWQHLRPLVVAEDLWDLFMLETNLLPLLLTMRWRGIRVGTDAVEQAVAESKREEARLQKKLNTLVGHPVSVWAEADLSLAFRAAGIIPPQTPRTKKDSFRAAWLQEVDTPLSALVLDIRQLEKSRVTFLEGYVLEKAVAGRVHGEFHPQRSDEGGAVTGRFSSSNPNLQNLPARNKKIKQLVRGAFLPEEGEEWAACDYSQQEPRLTVYYAARTRCRGGLKAAREYMENPDLDYHQFMADITGLPRNDAKVINLGVGYGMGGAKLCHSLGLPTDMKEVPDKSRPGHTKWIEVAGEEGQTILDQYDDNAPFVRELTNKCQEGAQKKGHIRTLLGRRCRLSDGHTPGRYRDFTYKAMNRLIQGSAADQTKAAMVACFKEGLVPLVTVHDELGFSIADHTTARRIKEIMEQCVRLELPQYEVTIPSKVDVELGPNWGAAAEMLKSEQDDDADLIAKLLGHEDTP
jgi:DNA polymerase I-like protein with 3'-5' exonuclease and polymerase domains